jgi:hypothetical protein
LPLFSFKNNPSADEDAAAKDKEEGAGEEIPEPIGVADDEIESDVFGIEIDEFDILTLVTYYKSGEGEGNKHEIVEEDE